MTIPISIPLMVINAGHSVISIPFFGAVNLGILYPLLIIPIGVVGAANGFNMLAGFNGLEAGLGTIILTTLGLMNIYLNNYWLSFICFTAAASLLGFLVFNWFPSKIFPGDTLTYSIGALIASIAILGNMEKIAVLLFTPYIVDLLLFLRTKKDGIKNPEAFGIPKKDNSLEMPYKKIYDCTHFAIWFLSKIKRKVYERDVVIFLLLIEVILSIIGFLYLLF